MFLQQMRLIRYVQEHIPKVVHLDLALVLINHLVQEVVLLVLKVVLLLVQEVALHLVLKAVVRVRLDPVHHLAVPLDQVQVLVL